jgi:hypothetical protein
MANLNQPNLQAIYRSGFHHAKAGVMLLDMQLGGNQ